MLGSHNSLSFAPPTKWWGKLFRFVGKCQSKNIQEQYTLGVRYFDIRIRFDKGDSVPAHGPMIFDCNIYEQLNNLLSIVNSDDKDPIYVRVILEYNRKQKNQDELDNMFKQQCWILQSCFEHRITFVGGRRKYDWEVIYDFGNEEPELEDKIDDWWPWLYAVTHNAKSYKHHDKSKVLFIDFVNIGHKYYED